MTFQFKIQIQNITKPPVWRRVVVPSETTFHMFHYIIQLAFGWENSHLYSFSPKGYGSHPWIEVSDGDYDDDDDDDFDDDDDDDYDYDDDDDDDDERKTAKEIKLSDIFDEKGQTFIYIYDFGDDWKHKITLEEIDKTNISPLPKLIDGKGACPPEDCGGVWGYEDLKEALSDKDHPEHRDMKEWFYGDADDETIWDPNEFDLEGMQQDFNDYFGDIE